MIAFANAYKSTAWFTLHDVPAGLLKSHHLKAGTWGQIELIAGGLRFVSEETGASLLLNAPDIHTIPPLERHHVEPDENTKFRIHFFHQNPELET